MNLKKFGKLFTSKFVGTGPSSYEKRIYRAAVSQSLRNTALKDLRFEGFNETNMKLCLCGGVGGWSCSLIDGIKLFSKEPAGSEFGLELK